MANNPLDKTFSGGYCNFFFFQVLMIILFFRLVHLASLRVCLLRTVLKLILSTPSGRTVGLLSCMSSPSTASPFTLWTLLNRLGQW